MRVGIVGAGIAGLVTAKVLVQAGHEVVVWDRSPDIGGVWSATRRYPGVTTQSARDTYAFSDHRMPASYPEWPSGEQVQDYLASYVRRFGLEPLVRLSTGVVEASPARDGWDVRLESGATERVDHLVIANGVFSAPNVPDYEGATEFAAAGGDLLAASEFRSVEVARGKRVVVVGYGKTACDVAYECSTVAASTDVIARQLLWKVPRKILNRINFKYLLLTRMGEALFRFEYLRGMEKFLHGPANAVRRKMLNSLGDVSVKQYKLAELGLVPPGAMEDIVKNAIGLTTDGFFEAVGAGTITVHKGRTIKRLLEKDGAPYAELSDGTVLRADLVVCGTGYRQEIPFLDPEVVARFTDERGNFQLYRQVHPVDVPRLSFAGYNSSFFSPLNAEMAAVWIAGLLAGQVDLPAAEEMRARVTARLSFMDGATNGHHSHGTKIIPFSLHNVDELLGDLGLQIGAGARAKQWLGPVDPADYREVTSRLLSKTR